MTLRLFYHPLSSFSHKVLTALYENDTAFTPCLLGHGNAAVDDEFRRLWPIAKMPILRDDARGLTLAESTTIIEYLGQHYPGKTTFIPSDPELARQVRFYDRFFDFYVHQPMQKIVTDKIRPAGKSDAFGVEQAHATLTSAYDVLEREVAGKTWIAGDAFTLADCAAAPPLYFANRLHPLTDARPNASAYFSRLLARPSYARALRDAEPFLMSIHSP